MNISFQCHWSLTIIESLLSAVGFCTCGKSVFSATTGCLWDWAEINYSRRVHSKEVVCGQLRSSWTSEISCIRKYSFIISLDFHGSVNQNRNRSLIFYSVLRQVHREKRGETTIFPVTQMFPNPDWPHGRAFSFVQVTGIKWKLNL